MNKAKVINSVTALIKRYASLSSNHSIAGLIPAKHTVGKLYEAHVLSVIIENLALKEKYTVVLRGPAIAFKSAPGPINRNYPYFELIPSGATSPVAELWTDTEFRSLSWNHGATPKALTRGDYHELDILITEPGIQSMTRPLHNQVWFGVECKHCAYRKELLRSVLGVRRELSFLSKSQPTNFVSWPQAAVHATPSSCLSVYSSDAAVTHYATPGKVFGIDFIHEPV